MTVIILVLALIVVVLLSIAIFILLKGSNVSNKPNFNYDELSAKGFDVTKSFILDRFSMLIFDNQLNKFAIVKNINPETPNKFNIKQISSNLVTKIARNKNSVVITYLKENGVDELNINASKNNQIYDYFHKMFLEKKVKKIKKMYPTINLTLYTPSDWECSYIFCFDKLSSILIYLDTLENKIHHTNLLKEIFIIDTKFKYFETSIFRKIQQLSAYDETFFDDVFNSLKSKIQNNYTEILKNKIYYNLDDNFVYVSNGLNSLESINLSLIERMEYQQSKLSFNYKNTLRTINFLCDNETIEEFKKFVLEYNLKKLANKFDFSIDKLINATQYTKFVIDYTRQRYLYCANLYSISNFSFVNISFSNVLNAQAIKSGTNCFVRISLVDYDKIDVSCDKFEVASYIKAQILSNINNDKF